MTELKSKILFDVFVSEPIPVNKIIYRSWLDGLTEKETAYSKELGSSTSNINSLNNSIMFNSGGVLNIPNSSNNSTTSTTPINQINSTGIIQNTGNIIQSSNLTANIMNPTLNITGGIIPTPMIISNTGGMSTSSMTPQGGMISNSSTVIISKETVQQLLSEAEDSFRNFTLLQTALEHPKTLSSNSMFQIDIINRRLLIEGYYDFDETLMRELIGRKLTSGQRRDLDDTSEKLKIRLSSCERQFDNLKRISRLVFLDIKSSALDIIMNEFCLPRELSRKYVRILFLCFHRFDLSKKRIQSLKTSGLIRLSEIIMNNLGDPIRTYTVELDIKLKEDVRDLKAYLTSQKEIPERYWKLIKNRYQTITSQSPKINSASTNLPIIPPLSTIIPTPLNSTNNTPGNTSSMILTTPLVGEKLRNLESKFKSILKGILSIGSNLSDSKEFRNLFDDIVEKIIDPLKRIDLTANEADSFFILLRDVFVPESLGLTSLRHKDRIVHNWKSFLEGIRGVVVYMYTDL